MLNPQGGGTGLALYVARGLVRAMGGELEVIGERETGTLVNARIPLCVAEAGMMPPLVAAPPPVQAPPPAAEAAAAAAALPQQAAAAEVPAPPAADMCAPPLLVDERDLTARMVQCILANSDDVLAICRISALPEAPLSVPLVYLSPSVECGRAFCQHVKLGQSLLDVAHPDDRDELSDAIMAAFRGEGPGGGHDLLCDHRSITAGGDSMWCQTTGVCENDMLYLVCRACPAALSVLLALRLACLPDCLLACLLASACLLACLLLTPSCLLRMRRRRAHAQERGAGAARLHARHHT
jgi:hypothetical protein